MADPRLGCPVFRDILRAQVGIPALRPLRGHPQRRWCAVRGKRTSWVVSSLLVGVICLSLPFTISAKPKYEVLAVIPGGLSGGLTFDSKGNLYGVTHGGGVNGYGSIFEMTRSSKDKWTVTTLYSFNFKSDGEAPNGDLILDAAGNLYGTTPVGGTYDGGTVFELSPSSNGWTFNVLHAFCQQSSCQDGGGPLAGLVQDKNGNVVGTARAGLYDLGVVFELTPGSNGWTYSVLYNFGARPRDGSEPLDAPVLDAKGNVYGTTYDGGRVGWGTVFELTPGSNGWRERLLWQFDGGDGARPGYSPILGAAGKLYGTTNAGGGMCDGYIPCGTAFELMRDGSGKRKETVLYDFATPENGFAPSSGLILGMGGILYGTTGLGGTGSCYDGCGVAYKLAPRTHGAWKYTVLHKFEGAPSGGGLILDSKSNLYGTAYNVVYEITP
jgi:uncharacterized repeat protein (TIGR03803 family)